MTLSQENSITTLAIEIANVFADQGFTWKIGGEQRVPSPDDVQAVLDRAKYEVEYQAVNSHLKNTSPQLLMRHLLFNQNDEGKIQVFIKIGEIE